MKELTVDFVKFESREYTNRVTVHGRGKVYNKKIILLSQLKLHGKIITVCLWMFISTYRRISIRIEFVKPHLSNELCDVLWERCGWRGRGRGRSGTLGRGWGGGARWTANMKTSGFDETLYTFVYVGYQV